jgi:flagellar protein FliO/FliZ
MRWVIGWTAVGWTWPVTAAAPQSLDLLNWLLSSLLVIGLLLACAWLLKKSRVGMVGGRMIQIISLIAVGRREKLMLVQVGGQQYLLGVTAQGITLLDKLEKPLQAAGGADAAPAFAAQLSRVLGRHDKD